MGFLRLGTISVVINDEGAVLLSRRGDIGTWSLPGGRLDTGECLKDAAIREVYEETGVEVELMRPAGLYYLDQWERLNVLFVAQMIGGEVKATTNETLENRFFSLDELPDDFYHKAHVIDALSGRTVVNSVAIQDHDYNRLRRQFALRWVKNLVTGNPEPRFPHFTVNAVGLMWDSQHLGVLNNGDQLPRVLCDGKSAPWLQLAELFVPNNRFQWLGVYEDTTQNLIELVFSTTIKNETAVLNLNGSETTQGTRIIFKENPFDALDTRYIKHTTGNTTDGVWFLSSV